jgi:uncharacterized protein with von Willebrand factor type A (vWA) domain
MSKGSRPRPFSVDRKTFDSNFDRIFRKPDTQEVEDPCNEDEESRALKERNKQQQKEKE